jgi:hypothetical protein
MGLHSHSVRAGKKVHHLFSDCLVDSLNNSFIHGQETAEKDRLQFQYYMKASSNEKYCNDTYCDLIAR